MMMKLKQFCITFALAGITASIAMSAETKLYAVKYHRPPTSMKLLILTIAL